METNYAEEYIRLLISDSVDIAINYKSSFIPARLYKYQSLKDLRNEKLYSLLTDNLWISNPEYMDDPYDSALHYNTESIINSNLKNDFTAFNSYLTELDQSFNDIESEEILSSINPSKKINEILFKQSKHISNEEKEKINIIINKVIQKQHLKILVEFNEIIKSSLKLTCFTEVNNSSVMWAKYADEHRGFCIEYDFKSLSSSDLRQRLLSPVKYTDDFFDVTSFILNKSKVQGILALLASLHKHTEWQYQKEWRLVIPGGMIAEDSYFQVPKAKAIYLGKDISQEDEAELVKIARFKKITVFKMGMSYDEPRLKFEEI